MSVETVISGAQTHPRPNHSPYSAGYWASGSGTVGGTGTQRVLPLVVGLALIFAGCAGGVVTNGATLAAVGALSATALIVTLPVPAAWVQLNVSVALALSAV